MADLSADDYVIVGAGSAGCVLADRLSEDGAQVVLLEAGSADWHPMVHVPAGALRLRANPPTVTTGNTNAPTIMIGEKGAAMIREGAAASTAGAATPARSAA